METIKKHKIGLISVHNPNYGSMLQTYALHSYLNEIGAENEIILYTKKKDWRQLRRLLNIQLVLMKGKVVYRDIYCKLFHPDIAQLLALRMEKFNEFKKNHFKFSRNHIGWKDLLTTNRDYNTFIIGSDQVWNPINIGTNFSIYYSLKITNTGYHTHLVLAFPISLSPK